MRVRQVRHTDSALDRSWAPRHRRTCSASSKVNKILDAALVSDMLI